MSPLNGSTDNKIFKVTDLNIRMRFSNFYVVFKVDRTVTFYVDCLNN